MILTSAPLLFVDGGIKLCAKSKSKYKIKHIGTVDEATMVFTPNPFFRLMDVDERIKYIFPK